MIYDELKNYLTKIASPEVVTNFDKAVEVYTNLGIEEYMGAFETTIAMNVDGTDQDNLDRLTNTLRSSMEQMLRMQGIEMSEETTLSMLIEVVGGLYEIMFYEDKDSIFACIDRDEGDAERLSDLLKFTTIYQADEIMPFIEVMRPGVMRALRERISAKPDDSLKTVAAVEEQIKAYCIFKNKINSEPIWADKYFNEIGSIGMPYSIYLRHYATDKGEGITAMTKKDVVKDLLSLAYLSSDGVGAALDTAKTGINTVYTDINSVAEASIALTNYFMEIERAQT